MISGVRMTATPAISGAIHQRDRRRPCGRRRAGPGAVARRGLGRPRPRAGRLGVVFLVAVVAEPGDEPAPGVIAGRRRSRLRRRPGGGAPDRRTGRRARLCPGLRHGWRARGCHPVASGPGVPLDPAPRRVRGAPRMAPPRITVAMVVVQRWRLRPGQRLRAEGRLCLAGGRLRTGVAGARGRPEPRGWLEQPGVLIRRPGVCVLAHASAPPRERVTSWPGGGSRWRVRCPGRLAGARRRPRRRHGAAAGAGVLAARAQRVVRLDGGEVLIDQAHREWGELAGQLGGEAPRAGRGDARPFRPDSEVGQAHDDLDRVGAGHEGGQLVQLTGARADHGQRAGQDATRIAAGDPEHGPSPRPRPSARPPSPELSPGREA